MLPDLRDLGCLTCVIVERYISKDLLVTLKSRRAEVGTLDESFQDVAYYSPSLNALVVGSDPISQELSFLDIIHHNAITRSGLARSQKVASEVSPYIQNYMSVALTLVLATLESPPQFCGVDCGRYQVWSQLKLSSSTGGPA